MVIALVTKQGKSYRKVLLSNSSSIKSIVQTQIRVIFIQKGNLVIGCRRIWGQRDATFILFVIQISVRLFIHTRAFGLRVSAEVEKYYLLLSSCAVQSLLAQWVVIISRPLKSFQREEYVFVVKLITHSAFTIDSAQKSHQK